MNARIAQIGPLCLSLAAVASAAADPRAALLQTLDRAAALRGAGCTYTRAEDAEVVMVVDARSDPRQRQGVARIQINGVVRQLDWTSTGESAPYIYARDTIRVELQDWTDDPQAPACGEECEGSFHRAQLRLRDGKQTQLLEVKVHCGA